MKAKERKILKLRRKIAALNGHKSHVFDAPKIGEDVYRDYVPPRGLLKTRMILSYFDNPDSTIPKFVVLVRTNKGIYLMDHVIRATCDLKPGSEYITIRIRSSEAFQRIKILGFKILDSLGRCIHVAEPYLSSLRVGNTFTVNYRMDT